MFSEIMERAVGPLLFAIGLSLLLVCTATQQEYLETAKELYADDAVYSQGSTPVDGNDSISRQELLGLIMSGASVPIKIEHLSGFPTISILVSKDSAMRVIVRGQSMMAPNEEIYNELLQDFDGFPQEALVASNYRMESVYDDKGKLENIEYIEEAE